MQNKTTVIGLTGTTGSGKSTAAAILKNHGAYIIDADKVAHEIMKKGQQAYNEIVETFGTGILASDGEIERKKLAAIVFSDKEKLEKLNSITHKIIVKKIKDEAEEKKNRNYELIVIDAPLLIQTGLHKCCDSVWAVYADEETRIERIIKRDDIPREKALERIRNQTGFQETINKYANCIINNESGAASDMEEIIEHELKCMRVDQYGFSG
ncbi:MAG: dephospho-CoA kinase [Firmicutes bacterium]|nr:dephospho-CoA kinase [Bacillota bacterium]